MATKHHSFVVIGLGTFGGTVALELARFGNHVTGIDRSERSVAAIADELDRTLILDAREDVALREAGIEICDVGVIAIGDDIEASILATITLKTLGIKKIWAKAASKNHHRILSKLGVDRVIHPEKEVGQHIAQVLHNPLVRDYVSLGNGQHVVNFRIPETLEGRKLDELKHHGFDLRCIGVMRGTEFLGQDGSGCVLQKDDLLLLLGGRKGLRDFAGSL
ncbi:TrkA family potassium uptake protein [Sulfitobacter albidus]|uniref:TrkA family potassium uptake protein n=1 Tax=Sulfitobacter albidus TaxID=2829501 RepID=A0A975JD42_9RHOB|nr:TrkA family potassium uptake protein [Sulfitobacter albidus]QUJ76261.1 TrkA family potassium uptake protein [Sulfitobacter albidus]